ncbi:MAG: hypothetical protein AB7I79_03085 [Rhizobiaceae bacterium]
MSAETDPLDELYQHLVARKTARPRAIRDLPPDDRLAYHAEANRRSRARRKAALASGAPEPTDAVIRQALSDAVIMLLAVDGPGSAQVMGALATAFPGRPGVPMTVQHCARTGSLRPKLIAVPATGLKSS